MMSADHKTCKWKFQAQPEYFFDYVGAAQSDPGFRAPTLHLLGLDAQAVTNKFGGDKSQRPWEVFASAVRRMNEEASDPVQYKVIYITRHGLGWHNVYEAEVGREAWNVRPLSSSIFAIQVDTEQNKWSHLDGDGTITWADSALHPSGIEQANALGERWSDTMGEHGMPPPRSIYTSPLRRCLKTTLLAFELSVIHAGPTFEPIIKEALRERLTDHTCDRRSRRSRIELMYPFFSFEDGFSEEDELWTGGTWETDAEHEARMQGLLEDLFEHDDETFISLTTHSYTISAILGVVGMGMFRVSEGSSIALLVRGEKIAEGSSLGGSVAEDDA